MNCRRCGAAFHCGSKENKCWCMDVPVVKNVPDIYDNCLCPKCLEHFQNVPKTAPGELIEGQDFYLENGFMVFTENYHLNRGHCCGSGCRHCPY